MSNEESKVIDMFSRKKPTENETTVFDFEDIKKANEAKAEKLARDRKQHNSKVKRDYKINPTK